MHSGSLWVIGSVIELVLTAPFGSPVVGTAGKPPISRRCVSDSPPCFERLCNQFGLERLPGPRGRAIAAELRQNRVERPRSGTEVEIGVAVNKITADSIVRAVRW